VSLKPLSQQVVVVFGASSGIGRETAKQFARHGASVVVAARTREALDELVQEIEADGGRAVAVAADAAQSLQVRAVAEAAVESFGGLDTWVHTASTAVWATFEETTEDEWKRIIDVNLNGTVYAAKAALPYLRKQGGGAFIAISSIEAEAGLPYQSAYAASKHGVRGFLDILRLELRHEGAPISVTNIMPSTINTPFFNNARTKLGVKPVGIPPIYQPHIVAQAILYAAENPTPEIIVGGGGKMFSLMKRFTPALADQFLLAVGFQGQRTKEEKSADAPTNLFEPNTGEDRIEGDYSNQARGTSVQTWLATHPSARLALTGLALCSAVWLFKKPHKNDGH
jgi:NAD(P)-dependent dehydrogenase (short-subunit alcohol dehydrogenase family)